MVFPQLEIEVYYVWVWFTYFLIYTVVALQLESVFDEVTEWCNAHMTHSKAEVIRYTGSDVYPNGM